MDDDVIFSPADTAMDFVDELFFDGCWLETTDASEFLNLPSTSNAFLDAPFALTNDQEEKPDNFNPQLKEQNMTGFTEECSNHAEPLKRWWIGPRTNPGPSVMQRLIQAVMNMENFTIDKDVLVQLWVPVNRGGRLMLVTDDQPFSLNPNSWRLVNYRDISVRYHFSVDEDSKDIVGLPGRVFMGKVPEWSPDVRFFKSDEYSRVGHAQRYDVRGTLAIPVFEQGSRTCLGVIEVVTTTERVQYRPELESVCKALEAVNLTSSVDSNSPNVKVCSKSYDAVLPEIKEVLRRACETYKLPLGQTWVPCIQQGKEGCRHSSQNYGNCVSTVDYACYIPEPSVLAFHETCSEHHLLKGQGVVGEAFMTNQPCFSPNVTSYKSTEYPLSHHAMIAGLRGAVAIRLRSIHTGNADFVLEFFLPKDCKDIEEQTKMLNSLSVIFENVCRSLRVVTDKELSEEKVSQTSEVTEVQQGIQNEMSSPLLIEKESTEVTISGVNGGKTGEKRRPKAERKITSDVLRQYFAGSLKDAAKSLGVCPTTLKRICRQQGIQRWPSRKLKKVDHSLKKLQNVIDSVHGASGAFQIGSFYTNFPELAPKSTTFATSSPCKPEIGVLSPQATILISPSTSCSQSSSSSHSFSSEKLRKVRSHTEIDVSGQEGLESLKKECVSVFNDAQRVKVMYGDENIRFRLQKQWRFGDLVGEIAKRFNIGDIVGNYDVKYLDDDSEWVLMTCDADLEECIDVCGGSSTIKLKLQASHNLVDRYCRTRGPS